VSSPGISRPSFLAIVAIFVGKAASRAAAISWPLSVASVTRLRSAAMPVTSTGAKRRAPRAEAVRHTPETSATGSSSPAPAERMAPRSSIPVRPRSASGPMNLERSPPRSRSTASATRPRTPRTSPARWTVRRPLKPQRRPRSAIRPRNASTAGERHHARTARASPIAGAGCTKGWSISTWSSAVPAAVEPSAGPRRSRTATVLPARRSASATRAPVTPDHRLRRHARLTTACTAATAQP